MLNFRRWPAPRDVRAADDIRCIEDVDNTGC
jgi:hypothetical protein